MYFDARTAKGLQPGAHIVVDGCPGLRLEAGAKRKTWVYRYKSPVDGRMRQIKIGHWPEVPPATAAARWQELRAQREAGTDPALAKRVERIAAASAPRAAYSLADLVADYAAGHLAVRREPRGAHAVRLRLEAAIAPHAAMPCAAVTRRFVFDLVEGLAHTPVVANSVKSELAAAWDYALSAGRLPESLPNWWRLGGGLKRRSLGAVRDGERKGTAKRVLTEAELATLFGQDLALFSQQVQDFLTLQLWTCTRGGEIAAMRVEHITQAVDGWWWTVPKASSKLRHVASAADQRVPLVGRALAVVARLLEAEQGGWLFPSRARTGELQALRQASVQSKTHYYQPYSQARPDHVRARLTVSHWSPHDLRRTGRTMLAAMGCPHEVGEAILGHVLPGVAGVYNLHRYDTERRHWLGMLAARLEHIIAGA